MDINILYVSLCIIFGIFLRGETSPISSPPCRAKVCDDRPECPKSSCRCLFPSKIDCDIYYQCVSGKPYQYKCSPGLLFNAETLSCDYEDNVNCTYGRTTESLPSSVPDVTSSSNGSTKYTLTPSTQYPIVTNDPSNSTSPDGSNTNDTNTSTDFNIPSSTKVTEFPSTKTTDEATDDFSTQDNEEPSTITNHPSDESSTVLITTTSSDPQKPNTTKTPTTVVTTSYTDPTPDIIITIPTSDETDTTIDFVVTDDIVTAVTADPTSDIITSPKADVTNPTSGDVATETTSKTTVSDTSSDIITTIPTSDGTDTTIDFVVTDDIVTAVTADPTLDIIITETTSKTTVSDTTSDIIITGHTDDVTNPSPDGVVTDQTTDKSISTDQTDLTPDVTITTPRPQEPTSKISFPTTTEENSTSEGYISTGKPTTEKPTQKPTTNGITDSNQQFECPSRFGLYPDLFNCSTFYQCSHWTAYQKECPSNLHFNPSLTVCDWPESAGCGETISTTTSKDNPTTSTTTSEPTYCDCDSCDLPIPDDCDSYILCIESSATVITCGDGLSYNPMTGTCDFRDHVQCESSVQCPKPDGRFPYPHSCSHYMVCEKEAMAVRKCPEEMVYDLENGRCSESAVCGDPETTSEIPTSNYPKETTQIDDNYSTKDSKDVTEDKTNTEPSSTTNPILSSTETSKNTESTERATTLTSDSLETFTTEFTTEDRYPVTETSSVQTTYSPSTTTAKEIISTVTTEEPFTSSSSTQQPSMASTQDEETTTASAKSSTTISTAQPTTEYTTVSKTTSNEVTTTEDTPTTVPSSSSTRISTEYTTVSRTTINEVTTSEETPTTASAKSSTTISTGQPTTEYTTDSRTTLNEVTTSEETPTTASAKSSTTISTEQPTTEYTTVSRTTINEVTTSEETPTTASAKSSTTISTGQPTTEYTTVSRTTINEVTTSEETPTTASAKSSTTISTGQPTTEYTTVSRTTLNEVTTSEETPTTASAKSSTTISTEQPTTEYTTVSRTTLTERTSTSGSNRTSISPLNFECPSRFGLFADPENCFRFYHCSQWIAHHKWCPSDLHFNPTLQVCDWPYRAGCGEKPILPTTPEEDKSPESDTSCDCECCFSPDPNDCSRYSLCLDGRTHEGQCANGLLFNPLNNNCDLAERVNCSKNLIECPSSDGSVRNPKNCSSFFKCVSGTPVLKQCPNSYHFSESEKLCVDPCKAKCDQTLDCPITSSTPKSEICIEDEALYRANDCSSFYQCTEGQAYLVQCPYGLHFNIEYGVCEHPCDALCDPNIECKHRSVRSLLCSSPNGLFPVPHDCGSFFMCSDGVEHRIHCPPGLHFNAIGGTCEEPCKARCNKTACKSSNMTSNFTSLNPDYNILSSNCKAANGIFPNPKDCGSFYQCKEGIENLVYCPVGLHFSVEEKICESPCVANCDINIEDCPTEIPDDEGNCTCHDCYLPDPTDCSAFYFCSQRHLTKGYCPYGTLFDIQKSRCEPEKNAVCETVADPVMCSSPFGFDPYPGDCGKFVHCIESVAYVKDCEPGLEFDPVVRACANPNGRCGRNGIDSSCLTPTGTFPHPENSSLFYQCEYGVAYLKECPFPLTFNRIDEVCDWPSNVQNEGPANIYLSEGKSASDECSKVPGVICPCACRVTTYDECNSFYHCQQDGTACKKFCPEGLYFNKRKMVCDLPENVECRDFFFTAMNKLRSLN